MRGEHVMSIRLAALLAFIVSLWSCGGHSMPTAPERAVIRSNGNLQSSDLSPSVPVGSVRTKPAVINAGSTTEARNHEGNPPTFNSSPHNLTLLLPHGPYSRALLKFNGEPATDPDGDNITYRFAFAVTGLSGIQSPSEALLRITRKGNNFAFRGNGDITPAQFTSVYGEDATIPTLLSAIYASDGTDESDPEGFNIHLVYDGSAQFSAPAEYIGDQRWEISTPIEMYEGTTMLETGQLPTWTAVIADHRNWGFDWSPPSIRCEVAATTYDVYTFPDGGDDNTLFSLDSESSATSGTVSLTFKTVPDYETPGDSNANNDYHVRVVNTHDIHRLGGEGSPTGCSGSVLDVNIRVKDVGTPAPPELVEGRFRETDDTTIDVNWTASGGFNENGTLVAFPTGFEVTDYDYRYRAAGTTTWTEVTDISPTETSVIIEGVTEDTYDIQVRANNSEGSGAWSPAIQARKIKRTICFMASHYTAVEGDPSGAEIAVYLDPAARALPITVPISVVEKEGAGPEDYSGVPSSITFAPGENMKTFTLTAMVDSDPDEGGEAIQLNFGDLPKNVTPETPATAEVSLKESIPVITGIQIISTPERGTTYGRGEIIKVEVTFDMPVEVTGIPFLVFEMDSNPLWETAPYKSGSGTKRLVFEYCVARSDRDRTGISIEPNQIVQFRRSTITAVSGGADANLNHAGLSDDPNHKVNGCL